MEPLQKRLEEQGAEIALGTRVTQIEPMADDLAVTVSDGSDSRTVQADRVLVAIGRTPNGATITAEAAGVTVDERGFIPVDDHLRTSVDHIHAIGDVIGHPMLAQRPKDCHEGRVRLSYQASAWFVKPWAGSVGRKRPQTDKSSPEACIVRQRPDNPQPCGQQKGPTRYSAAHRMAAYRVAAHRGRR